MCPQISVTADSWATAAVPAAQQYDALAVAALLPPARLSSTSTFTVRARGEELTIPYRIYHREPDSADLSALTGTQRIVLDCLYTRHHDGRVRQRHLRSLLPEARSWVVPFVVQLMGEYVSQILVDIRDGLVDLETPGTRVHAVYGEFGSANPKFVFRTRQRAASYWDCYYRNVWSNRSYYPGYVLTELLRQAALHHRSRETTD